MPARGWRKPVVGDVDDPDGLIALVRRYVGYLDEVRPRLVAPPGDPALFLTEAGAPLKPARLTQLMRRYVDMADLGKTGACHIFRHTMATLMLEGGADIRLIQEILGHAETSTTEIYTRLSIKHLKVVHDRTHPGASLERAPRTEGADHGE